MTEKRWIKRVMIAVILISVGIVITWLHLWMLIKLIIGLFLFGISCMLILAWLQL